MGVVVVVVVAFLGALERGAGCPCVTPLLPFQPKATLYAVIVEGVGNGGGRGGGKIR